MKKFSCMIFFFALILLSACSEKHASSLLDTTINGKLNQYADLLIHASDCEVLSTQLDQFVQQESAQLRQAIISLIAESYALGNKDNTALRIHSALDIGDERMRQLKSSVCFQHDATIAANSAFSKLVMDAVITGINIVNAKETILSHDNNAKKSTSTP